MAGGRRVAGWAAATVVAVLFGVTGTTAQDFDFGEGKTCSRFGCPSGKEAVPKRPLKLESQGCNSMGGMAMMSGGAGQDEVTPCCNLRQACFQTCGMSKSKCEDTFSKCVAALCSQNHPGDSEGEASCAKTANLYVTMSKLGGCREWDSAQARACQCVDEDNAVKRRTKSLEDIYKKVNKDKLSDVPALAKKHGTSASKFSKLVVKLIRKYPRLITVKRSKEQDMMDRIRRGNFNPDELKAPDATKEEAKTEEVEEEGDAYEEVVVHDET